MRNGLYLQVRTPLNGGKNKIDYYYSLEYSASDEDELISQSKSFIEDITYEFEHAVDIIIDTEGLYFKTTDDQIDGILNAVKDTDNLVKNAEQNEEGTYIIKDEGKRELVDILFSPSRVFQDKDVIDLFKNIGGKGITPYEYMLKWCKDTYEGERLFKDGNFKRIVEICCSLGWDTANQSQRTAIDYMFHEYGCFISVSCDYADNLVEKKLRENKEELVFRATNNKETVFLEVYKIGNKGYRVKTDISSDNDSPYWKYFNSVSILYNMLYEYNQYHTRYTKFTVDPTNIKRAYSHLIKGIESIWSKDYSKLKYLSNDKKYLANQIPQALEKLFKEYETQTRGTDVDTSTLIKKIDEILLKVEDMYFDEKYGEKKKSIRSIIKEQNISRKRNKLTETNSDREVLFKATSRGEKYYIEIYKSKSGRYNFEVQNGGGGLGTELYASDILQLLFSPDAYSLNSRTYENFEVDPNDIKELYYWLLKEIADKWGYLAKDKRGSDNRKLYFAVKQYINRELEKLQTNENVKDKVQKILDNADTLVKKTLERLAVANNLVNKTYGKK